MRTCEKCGAVEDNEKYIECFGPEDRFICTSCHTDETTEEMERTHNEGRWMEHTHKDHEVWTYHTDLTKVIGVDGSVCVGIVGERQIMYNGKQYEISVKQADELWKDIIYGEYGTNDMKAILKIEGFGDLIK